MAIEAFILDTNVVDEVLADSRLLDDLRRLTEAGRVRLLFTHVQIDEVLETPESNPKRQHLVDLMSRLPVERVPTYGLVLGRSRIGHARVSGNEGTALIERLIGGSPNNVEDALITATAWKECATFVSAEITGGAIKRARREGIAALHVEEFAALVTALTPLTN